MVNDSDPRGLPFAALVAARAASVAARNAAVRRAVVRGATWVVVNGGSTPETSHSWDVLGQRFALDFVQADEGFRTHQGPAAPRSR